jgi:hypothetical protein
VTARRSLRAVAAAASGALVLAPAARAAAPGDQYGLFNPNNTVIHDKQTGLIWQRYASTTFVSFDGAATLCASLSLDDGDMNHTLTGWRVPSYKELLTIVDEVPHTEYEGSMLVPKAIDSNAFPQTPVDRSYWTSSLYPAAQNQGYLVSFADGVPHYDGLSQAQYYVRCVHD